MTADDFRGAIESLGLSKAAAATLLGVDERTSRKWWNGERAVPGPAIQFLTYLLRARQSGDNALDILGG